MRQFLKCSRRRSSSSRRPSRSSSRRHSMMSNLLRVKQISIGVNKIDSDTAGSKQEKCDESSNEMKRMLIKICWTKDFIEKNTQPVEAVGATKCSQNSATLRTWCQYSHFRMAVNQKLLSNTKHIQEQTGAITLTLFGPPRDIYKTTLQQPQRVGALP